MSYPVSIVFLSDKNKEIIMPKKATKFSAGFDVVSNEEDVMLYPNQIKVFSTGFGLVMPRDIFAEVRSRSGLSTKGVFVVNSPGTIDSDYELEVKVILGNFGHDPYNISKFDRIAQLVFRPIMNVELMSDINPKMFKDPGIRSGGLGSTGK